MLHTGWDCFTNQLVTAGPDHIYFVTLCYSIDRVINHLSISTMAKPWKVCISSVQAQVQVVCVGLLPASTSSQPLPVAGCMAARLAASPLCGARPSQLQTGSLSPHLAPACWLLAAAIHLGFMGPQTETKHENLFMFFWWSSFHRTTRPWFGTFPYLKFFFDGFPYTDDCI